MIIMGSMIYPTGSAKEAAKHFTKLPPLPKDIKMIGPFVRGTIDKGIQTLTLYEVAPPKLAEGMQAIGDRYATYIGISGLTYSIDVWYEAAEALAMIGMK